jgi:hypothetical protein
MSTDPKSIKPPGLLSPQAPISVGPNGAMSAEWFKFIAGLLAYTAALEARIAALEA